MARRTYAAICQHCRCEFESLKPDRKYCSLKCYAATPEFKARRDETLRAARAQYKPMSRTGETRPCAHCGTVMYLKPSEIKRGKKTCSRLCYRKHLAERFDRSISAPVTYAALHGYDEFLTQDKLPCLVDGCDWAGDNLSLHMNQTHGVTEEQFKRGAGFNLHTGVVSASMAENLKARGNRGNPQTLDQKRAVAAPGRCEYRSREAIEHMKKSALLRAKKGAP